MKSASVCTLSWPSLLAMLVIASLQGLSSRLCSQEPSFERVQQILVERCFDCHAGESAESGFRLDAPREKLLAGGESGQSAVVPGKPEASSLLAWITSEDEYERMPPDGEPLSADQIQTIREWIAAGAPMNQAFRQVDSQLWSFQPIQRKFSFDYGQFHAAGDPVENAKWAGKIHNPVDYFLARRLQEKNLHFRPLEKRETFIRRLYLVVLGLPPTPAEVEEFVRDQRPDANLRLIDRVLASTGFGERWAQHWLDIIRFGETHGFETNQERPNAWPFRDYVIESLNADKPYEQFVREQLAGDQLGSPVATGFIVAGPHDLVKSPDINLTLMQRQDELADIVNVTGTTFLGLTVGCARCHNHKFDPISQKDFYSMQAIFAGVQHADRVLPPSRSAREELVGLRQATAELEKKLEPWRRKSAPALLSIDDDEAGRPPGTRRIEYLVKPAGAGTNPPGQQRGYRDDPGSASHPANISGGTYTWWMNQPGQALARYLPARAGKFRIWISWGAGYATHSQDARYELDRDGDLATDEDRRPIARVNQQQLVQAATDLDSRPAGQKNGGESTLPSQPLWSGFYNAGVHDLTHDSAIILRGGETGTAVTADILLFEPVEETELAETSPGSEPMDQSPQQPAARAAVSATHNVEEFREVEAKYIRFTIHRANQSQPCIDELEVFSEGVNVALADRGAVARSSGDFVHEFHKLEYINDGMYGNSRSWIASQEQGWVEIELPEPRKIQRIEWARDREGRYADRLAIDYSIEVALEDRRWVNIAGSGDRLPPGAATDSPTSYDFSQGTPAEAAQAEKWLAELSALRDRQEVLAEPVRVYAGTYGSPGPTHRLYRGDPLQKREQVAPDTIESLGDLALPMDAAEEQRRLDFANWLTQNQNPLVARVLVNRLWQHLFGRGIVATPNDFGNSGQPPTHPLLLDWLARELVESGWSIKHVLRLMLTSHAFQQSSQADPEGMAVDASCQFWWRFPPRRLEAEAIRDSILAVSGQLDREVGGPGFSGFEIERETVRHFFPKTDFGPEDWRRMVYMTKVRQERDAVFGAFDCPDASQIVDRRSRSTTPLQSLNLLNSRFVLQQAAMMAERLQRAADRRKVSPVQVGYELAFSRSATASEIAEAESLIHEYGLAAFCRALLNANEFLFVQ